MPEGDTIFRAARTLHRALAGKPVTAFASMFPALNRVNDDAPITGRTIERVHSVGKHLLFHFSGDLVLRTHMRMNGSWHIYRTGEKWQRPRRDMRIVIATADFEAVGFNIPVAEFLSEREVTKSPELRTLGPDVLADDFDSTKVIANLRQHSDSEIAEALLNQHVLAGLGNVYKSEILFLCRIDPSARVEELTEAQLKSIVEESRQLLQLNVSEGLELMTTYGGMRRTTRRGNPSDRLWVYGRARLPCRRCGTPIRVRKQGRDARLTYFCPRCQRDGSLITDHSS
jgi:endonuclease VIII